MPDLKFIALVFAIVLLIVVGVRQAVKKVKKQQVNGESVVKKHPPMAQPKLTEDQFNRLWKNLSYLLLLASAGNLYMVYTSVRSAIQTQPTIAWVYWIDAVFSLLAAVTAVIVWRKRKKTMVYLYFAFTLVPVVLFMSIKGFKVNALIHMFPLVLLYFVLQPVWSNMKD